MGSRARRMSAEGEGFSKLIDKYAPIPTRPSSSPGRQGTGARHPGPAESRQHYSFASVIVNALTRCHQIGCAGGRTTDEDGVGAIEDCHDGRVSKRPLWKFRL